MGFLQKEYRFYWYSCTKVSDFKISKHTTRIRIGSAFVAVKKMLVITIRVESGVPSINS